MPKECLTREELTERLKVIAKQKTRKSNSFCAMCYITTTPSEPQKNVIKCDLCGNKIETYDYFQDNINELKKIVRTINRLTYKAKIQCVCKECASILGFETNEPITEVFYFKAKGDKKYHLAVALDSYDYDIVAAFLANEPFYYEYGGSEGRVKDHLDVIERMTGISIH